MKISCDIIRDVLPLYAEDMVSNATKEMVDEHLTDCEACTKELDNLRQPAKLPVEVETNALKRVGDSIRRRRILAVMAVFLFIATVLIGGALMLDAHIYLSAGDSVEDIYVEGNTVKIIWADYVIATGDLIEEEENGNYGVTAWTNLFNILFPVERVPYDQLADDVKAEVSEEQYNMLDNSTTYEFESEDVVPNFWYVQPEKGTAELLLNTGMEFPQGPLGNVTWHTRYYAVGLAAFCILSFLFGCLFKGRWYGELAYRIAILASSLAVSVVIVTAGQFSCMWGQFSEALIDSTAVALPMTLFGLCVRQLIKLNRQDKGL